MLPFGHLVRFRMLLGPTAGRSSSYFFTRLVYHAPLKAGTPAILLHKQDIKSTDLTAIIEEKSGQKCAGMFTLQSLSLKLRARDHKSNITVLDRRRRRPPDN